tara:strand:- start:118 stop:852 length:735 start_codon:yes stop_codon:yes gene_type:complete
MKINILSISTSERVKQTKTFFENYNWNVNVFNNDNKFPSWGRNAILETFYDSTDEWCCICDDDITLFDDRNETIWFLNNTIEFLSMVPKCITTFWGLNGILDPVNIIQQGDKHTKHWSFKREWNGGKMIFVRNTGKRYFQRTDLDYAEDAEFMYQQLADGLWTGKLENIVLRERGATQLFSTTDRREAIDRTQNKIVEIHRPLIKWKNDKLDRKELFMKAYPQKHITIPFTHKETIYNKLFEEV